MKCPDCNEIITKVIDSRLTEKGYTIRRRRECESCSHRFTTYEYVFPKKFIIYLLIITLGSTLIFFSQYYLHLQTQVQFPPILPVKISSRIIHFFTIWGVFILIIMPLFLNFYNTFCFDIRYLDYY